MASPRRIGAPDAKNRVVLLDAAEQLLLEEGYAAVTSRRVAETGGTQTSAGALLLPHHGRPLPGGVPPQGRGRGSRVLATALASPQPLWALWRFSTQPEATRLTMEFMGLANHRKALRAEIVYFAERFREEQNKAIATALERYGIGTSEVPPVVWTVFATSVSQGSGDGTGARNVLRSRRDVRVLRAMDSPTEGDPLPGRRRRGTSHQLRSEQSAPFGP